MPGHNILAALSNKCAVYCLDPFLQFYLFFGLNNMNDLS